MGYSGADVLLLQPREVVQRLRGGQPLRKCAQDHGNRDAGAPNPGLSPADVGV